MRLADQRIVTAEEMISRLQQLAAARRGFGLATERVEALIARMEAQIESWTRSRSALLDRPVGFDPQTRTWVSDPAGA